MTAKKALAGLILTGALSWTGTVAADAVTDWNEITMNAVTLGRPGAPGTLDMALVHVAVHDAVQAIEQRFEPYHVEIKGAKGSRSAAVAAAAHDVLVGLYPAQAATLDATYYSYLADKGLAGDPGLAVGQKVAVGILPLRRPAPEVLPPPFIGGTEPGQWRPTESFQPGAPASFLPMAAPWLGSVDPMTLTSGTRFRPAPPPALTSARYKRDFDEVKALGAFASTVRTAEQTDLAHFYSENFFTQWNRALRGIAQQHLNRTGDSARMFALANLSLADAVITSWDSKRHYAFWRPLTAIREAANDGNPGTTADPNWQPLLNTPNYPDYTSGANNVTAAMTRTLELFFDTDRVTFDMTSLAPLATRKTRTYRRFSDAASDMVVARIYAGIHFRTADEVARTQGTRVAEHVFDHFLLPLDERDSGRPCKHHQH
ncbi:MAG TPA: vanadium-dependent haloperoxidase [Steroidobacteraceae bacterium]|nr:vanadium-dependent haloperoxidase [Steroidobacteraceae bacterium]